MQQNSTRIAIVLDRSGSMQSVRESTVSGFNAFLRSQHEVPGECSVKLVQFDDQYETVFDKPLKDAPQLTQDIFVPRGSTALLDAQGRTIDELGTELAALPEAQCPSKVIVVTITDGLENASRVYSPMRIAEMVKHQRETYGWEFLYLGANQDAIKVAEAMNIPAGASLTYAATSLGMASAMGAAGGFLRRARTGEGPADFTEEERSAAVKSQE